MSEPDDWVNDPVYCWINVTDVSGGFEVHVSSWAEHKARHRPIKTVGEFSVPDGEWRQGFPPAVRLQ